MCVYVYTVSGMFLSICRYHKLLLYLGITATGCKDLKIQKFCKVLADFSLEYKTTREKILAVHASNVKKAKDQQTRLQMQKKKISAVDVSENVYFNFSFFII